MKKILIAYLIMLLPCLLHAQLISKAEYYYDGPDPGQGNAMPITITTPADSVNFSPTIPITGLSAGMHMLHLRTMNTNNTWSLYEPRIFMVAGDTGKINWAEYFFDSFDPGQGNATPISISNPADSVNFNPTISIAGLTTGLHVLHLRTRTSVGTWSLFEPRLFMIAGDTSKLSAAEYFYDSDPGFGNGTSIAIVNASDSVTINATSIVPSLSLGAHIFYYRVRDALGVWSLYEARDITICSTYGAHSDFNYNIDGNVVYFNTTSEYDSTHYWTFGDGVNTNDVFTTHTYATAGIYNACLITSNVCATDTGCKNITIRGIQSISPTRGGDSGLVVVYISGFGFLPGSTVRFSMTGQPDLTADSTFYIDDKNLRGDFFFATAVHQGLWNVIVNIPGFGEDTLFNAFTIEPRIEFKPWVQVIGPNQVLIGQYTHYRVAVGNNGNTTVFGIPVYISVTGNRYAFLLSKTLDDLLPQNIIDSVPHFFMDVDSIANDSVLLSSEVISYIEPGSIKYIDFFIKSTIGNSSYNISAVVGRAFYSESDFVNLGVNRSMNSCTFLPQCVQCLLDLLSFGPPGISCAAASFSMGCSIGNAFNGSPGSGRAKIADFVANVANTALSCVAPGLPLATIEAEKAMDLANRINAGGSGASAFLPGGAAPGSCLACPPPPPTKDEKNPFTRYFWDPNLKEGPLGRNSFNFISGKDPLYYNIYFSNADTATAPVSVVDLNDQLDTAVFDRGSLVFDGFGYGDSIVFFDKPVSSFTQDIDLRPARNIILRVTGSQDTNGKLSWRFLSLDTISRNITTNFMDGFLPPNVNSPEGIGFVSYHISPKNGLPHLQSLVNRAEIIFGDNAPVITPDWVNTIDTVKPVSSVHPLSAVQPDSSFTLTWNGTDADAGLRDYFIYVSINGGPYYPWITGTPDTSVIFKGQNGNTYSFYSIAHDYVGNEEIKTPIAEATTTITVGIKENTNSFIALLQNKPNPFTGNTTIEFSLTKTQSARLQIFDLFGRIVYETTQKKFSEGKNSIEVSSSALVPGVYDYRLITGIGVSESKKMVVLK